MTDHAPQDAPEPDALPYPLTFFLSARERREVLRALKARRGDRARALLSALGVTPDPREDAPDG